MSNTTLMDTPVAWFWSKSVWLLLHEVSWRHGHRFRGNLAGWIALLATVSTASYVWFFSWFLGKKSRPPRKGKTKEKPLPLAENVNSELKIRFLTPQIENIWTPHRPYKVQTNGGKHSLPLKRTEKIGNPLRRKRKNKTRYKSFPPECVFLEKSIVPIKKIPSI